MKSSFISVNDFIPDKLENFTLPDSQLCQETSTAGSTGSGLSLYTLKTKFIQVVGTFVHLLHKGVETSSCLFFGEL